MRYHHESSQGRSSENGMVGGFKVGHLEFDVFLSDVFPDPEGNWQGYCAKWHSRVAWDNSVEWSLGWG